MVKTIFMTVFGLFTFFALLTSWVYEGKGETQKATNELLRAIIYLVIIFVVKVVTLI